MIRMYSKVRKKNPESRRSSVRFVHSLIILFVHQQSESNCIITTRTINHISTLYPLIYMIANLPRICPTHPTDSIIPAEIPNKAIVELEMNAHKNIIIHIRVHFHFALHCEWIIFTASPMKETNFAQFSEFREWAIAMRPKKMRTNEA